MKAKKAIFLGVMLLLVASFMLPVGCAKEATPTPESAPSTTPATPTPESAPSTTPATTTPPIESLNIDSSLWDTELSYSVKYPTGWKVEGASSDDNVLFMNEDDIKDNYMPSSLGISAVPDLDARDMEGTVSAFHQSLSDIYNDYFIIGTSETQINDNTAITWTWTGNIDPAALLSPEEKQLAVVTGTQLMNGKSVLLTYADVVYWVFYMAGQEIYDERYFDWFLDNLEFRPYSSESSAEDGPGTEGGSGTEGGPVAEGELTLFDATILSIDGNMWTVITEDGEVWEIDVSQVVIYDTDVQVGLRVSIEGTVLDDNTIVAVSASEGLPELPTSDTPAEGEELELDATILSIDGNIWTVITEDGEVWEIDASQVAMGSMVDAQVGFAVTIYGIVVGDTIVANGAFVSDIYADTDTSQDDNDDNDDNGGHPGDH